MHIFLLCTLTTCQAWQLSCKLSCFLEAAWWIDAYLEAVCFKPKLHCLVSAPGKHHSSSSHNLVHVLCSNWLSEHCHGDVTPLLTGCQCCIKVTLFHVLRRSDSWHTLSALHYQGYTDDRVNLCCISEITLLTGLVCVVFPGDVTLMTGLICVVFLRLHCWLG